MTTDSVYDRTKTMIYRSWLINIKLLMTIMCLDGILCSRESFLNFHRRPNTIKPGEDPCNPLYWYPRTIPEYCYYKDMTPKEPAIRYPKPYPESVLDPLPSLPPLPPPMPPVMYPLPFGIPLAPTNPMLPIAGIPFPPPPMHMPTPIPPLMPPPLPLPSPFVSYVPPYGIQRRPMSMVPGLPGLVSPSGGINLLPFSDAYADVLEKHKQRMIRKRLQKMLDEYDNYPRKGSYEDTRRVSTRRQNSNDIVEEDEPRRQKESDILNVEQGLDEMMNMEERF